MQFKPGWLPVLQALAHHHSVSLAAEQLGYTQQAVSYTLNQIEQAFKCRLFERQGRRLRMTAEGQRVLMLGDKYLETLSNLRQELQHVQIYSQATGWRIARSNSFTSSSQLGRLLAEILKAFPQTQLSLEWVLQTHLEAWMLKEQIPLGLSFCPAQDPALSSLLLFESAYVWVAHRDYRQALDIPLIQFKYHPLNQLQHLFSQGADFRYLSGFAKALPRSGISSGNLLETLQLVKEGCGKACLPRCEVEADLARGELFELASSDQKISAYLLLAQDLLPEDAVAWFRQQAGQLLR